MKKYINFNYKYKSTVYYRASVIKEVGFDGVFVYSQYEPESYMATILNSELEIETLHLPYKLVKNGICLDSKMVNNLWLTGITATDYIESLIKEIKMASKYNIKKVVMHITGGDNPPPISEIGIDRIKKLLEICEKDKISLCLENTRRLDYIQKVFEAIDSTHLKFCFDSGHANCMTKNIDNFPWEIFKNKLCCLHLNDNDGLKDLHAIPYEGNINWTSLISKIFAIEPNIDLTLEVRANENQISSLSEMMFLRKCFDSLNRIALLKG